MKNHYKLGILCLALTVVLAMIGLATMTGANATRPVVDPPCTEVITVVDEEAWTEAIEHPEVTETIHHDAVTETTPAIWANWAPNNSQGPQDYVPIWPTDERGTWILHDQGIPPGHAGPDGVYRQGGGNSPWFYRQAEKVVVVEEAYDEVVVVEEAWTEVIEHPEVTHEETVEVDCPEEPENPEEPETPETHEEPKAPANPVSNPTPTKQSAAPQVPTSVDAGM